MPQARGGQRHQYGCRRPVDEPCHGSASMMAVPRAAAIAEVGGRAERLIRSFRSASNPHSLGIGRSDRFTDTAYRAPRQQWAFATQPGLKTCSEQARAISRRRPVPAPCSFSGRESWAVLDLRRRDLARTTAIAAPRQFRSISNRQGTRRIHRAAESRTANSKSALTWAASDRGTAVAGDGNTGATRFPDAATRHAPAS